MRTEKEIKEKFAETELKRILKFRSEPDDYYRGAMNALDWVLMDSEVNLK